MEDEKSGSGIVAFITNHSYLTEPTFRGMRRSLMQTFDDIYLFDLHGNSIKREHCPDGTRDDNIFDITQGVAIAVLVRKEGGHLRNAAVRHTDLFGIRTQKYSTLQRSCLDTISEVVSVSALDYLFKPQNSLLTAEYKQWPKITEVFGLATTGFKTHRDHFAVAFNQQEMQVRLEDLRSTKSDDALAETYNLPGAEGWTLLQARNKLKGLNNYHACTGAASAFRRRSKSDSDAAESADRQEDQRAGQWHACRPVIPDCASQFDRYY